MTDLDNSRATGDGTPGGPASPEAGRMPFFPAPPGRHATPPSGAPLAGGPTVAPTLAPSPPPGHHRRDARTPQPGQGAPAVQEQAEEAAQAAETPQPQAAAVVKGRITIEDEVVEKIAALAALEVDGVAALSGRTQAVRVHRREGEVSLDLTIVVEYGCVIMDVARLVKGNVARVISRMLGMRVTAVNVVVDDVRAPEVRA